MLAMLHIRAIFFALMMPLLPTPDIDYFRRRFAYAAAAADFRVVFSSMMRHLAILC